jgi:hypothetical protein
MPDSEEELYQELLDEGVPERLADWIARRYKKPRSRPSQNQNRGKLAEGWGRPWDQRESREQEETSSEGWLTNPDDELRSLERLAATGDIQAQVKLVQERLRIGEITADQVYVAALFGEPMARNYFLSQPESMLAVAGIFPAVTDKEFGQFLTPTTLPEMFQRHQVLDRTRPQQAQFFWNAVRVVSQELSHTLAQDAINLDDSLRFQSYLTRLGYAGTSDRLRELSRYFDQLWRVSQPIHFLAGGFNLSQFQENINSAWYLIRAGLPGFRNQFLEDLRPKIFKAIYGSN